MTNPEEVTVAVLLTQVADAQSLAAACAMNKLKVTAVSSPIGAYGVCHDLSAGKPQEVAKAVSALVQSVPVILITASSGQMKAEQWQAGEVVGKLPVALVLDGAPHELEDLLLQQTTVEELPDTVFSGDISRFKALRMLAGAAKAYKAKAK